MTLSFNERSRVSRRDSYRDHHDARCGDLCRLQRPIEIDERHRDDNRDIDFGATSTAAPATPVSSATATATRTTGSVPLLTPSATGSSATATPQGTATAGTSPQYLDDRSTAQEVILSYYNAINAKQYARAYSYWETNVDSSQLPPFQQFQHGYATTLAVGVTFGSVSSGVGAGQIYFSVPVELQSKTSDNGEQTFVGCYTLHLGNPAIQTSPPYHPLAIQSAKIDQVASIASAQDLLANACNDQPGSGAGPTVTPPSDPNDISANNYLDNRSDGAAVMRSYYNAINTKQYARAYSYWETNVDSSQLAPFDQFQQGYAQTKSVALTIGNVRLGAAAGNLYASVPATIVATMTDGSTQTFVGCYTLHLASPDLQSQPPFQPMGIRMAKVDKVDNGADTTSLMAKACQP